jgi:pectin methylesterase-like acyl-CoA thioesterase
MKMLEAIRVGLYGRWILGGLAVLLLGLAAPLAQAGNYYIDPNYAGTEGAPYVSPGGVSYAAAYNNIVSALVGTGSSSGAIPSGTAGSPNIIYMAPGVYNTAYTTGVPIAANSLSPGTSLKYQANNVSFVGTTGNPDDVVITSTLDAAYNPGSGALGTTGSATLQLTGTGVSAENMTFANGTDTPYIVATAHQAVTPAGTYTGNAQTSTSQCVALLLQGDQQAFSNVKVLGYQDSLYSKGGRVYFANSYVTGDIDFIFANGTTVFNNSVINDNGVQPNGGTVTAASTDKRTSNGIVFLNSQLTTNSVRGNPVIDPNSAATATTPAAGSQFLGRPWGWTQTGGDASTVFINTKMAAAFSGAGWEPWDSTETSNGSLTPANNRNNNNPGMDTRYAEYNSMDLIGNPLDVSGRATWSHQLTASQAAAYTVSNLFAGGTGGTDTWYGLGYPVGDLSNPGTGVADPTNPNYSWPAYWGDRNAQNEGATGSAGDDLVAGTPGSTTTSPLVPGNPGSYSDPSWKAVSGGGNWNAFAQLNALPTVPEPATAALLAGLVLMPLARRPRRR